MKSTKPRGMLAPNNQGFAMYLPAALYLLVLAGVFFLPPDRDLKKNVVGGVAVWNGNAEPVMPLDGAWEFRNADLTLDDWARSEYAELPYAWKKPNTGFASYRVRIEGLEPGKAYSLKLPYQATAYELFLDRVSLSSNGRPGTDKNDSVPGYLPRIATFAAKASSIELILHVSNFHHRRGGPFRTIYFGEPEGIRQLDDGRALSDWFIALIYLTMGLYQAGFFFVRKELSILYLALFLLFAGANGMVNTAEVLIFRVFPAIPWNAFQRLCYLAPYGASLWLFLFARRLYGGIPNRVSLLLAVPFPLIFLLVLFSPPIVFTAPNAAFLAHTLCVHGVVLSIFFRAFRAKEQGAAIMLVGFLYLGTTAVSSILFTNDLIGSGGMMPLAFLQYYRLDLFQRYSLSLTTLSYLATAAFVCIFGFAYIARHPSLFKPNQAAETAPAIGVEEAAARFGFSPREIEIARLLLQGDTNKEIADKLCISLSTVKTHVSRVFRKAGVETRTELFFKIRGDENRETATESI